MKLLITFLTLLFSNNLTSQSIDSIKIELKIKIDISHYSRNCWSPEWFSKYLNTKLNVRYLDTKGLTDVSVIMLDCSDSGKIDDVDISDFFNLSGTPLFIYDHLRDELYNVNYFTDESRVILKKIFLERCDYDAPINVMERKKKFVSYFKIEGIDMSALFDFMDKGQKNQFNSFGIIKF